MGNGHTALSRSSENSHQRIDQDQAEAIEGIRQGLETMRQGEGSPAAEVFSRLRAKHNIPKDP